MTTLDALQNNSLFSGVCRWIPLPGWELAGGMRALGRAGSAATVSVRLGIRMQLGRGIGPDDDRQIPERVAVITGRSGTTHSAGPDALAYDRIEDSLFTIVGGNGDRFTGLLLGLSGAG